MCRMKRDFWKNLILPRDFWVLLESVLEGMAEYYSAELSEKILRGMTENALKGKMNGGQSPFGYFVDEDRKLQIDPKTAPIVQDIFTMYADGKRMQEIVDWLKAKNICTQKASRCASTSYSICSPTANT